MPRYYPKSQIQPELYTNGEEYFLINTQTPYIGYYYKLSTNKSYTGKNPNNGVGIELIPNTSVSGNPNSLQLELSDNLITTTENKRDGPAYEDSEWYNNNTTLVSIYPKLQDFQPRTFPTPYFPAATIEEVTRGEYRRYFAKKTNEWVYIEISKETYNKYKSNDPTVASDLYEVLHLPWDLSSQDQRDTQFNEVNRKVVAIVERDNKWYGFSSYFRDNFG